MGCTLPYTSRDHEQGRDSREQKSGPLEHISKERLEKIREAVDRASKPLLVTILSDPKHRAHKSVKTLLAKAIDRKMVMTDKEMINLPEVFALLLRDHPDAMGLFKKASVDRGPGASPIQHHYEVFAPAALKVSSFKTSSGKVLSIGPTDRVDFGIKLSRDYGQPKRFGTIEADVMVNKSSLLAGAKTVGIDAKHSQTEKYGVHNKGDFQRQLNGIRTGLRDGKIQEFYFVTNGEFSKDFKKMVAAENLAIAKDYAKSHNLLYHDEKHGIDKEYLTQVERENLPPGKIDPNFFNENNKQTETFIDRYHIQQIDLCEFVKFPGT